MFNNKYARLILIVCVIASLHYAFGIFPFARQETQNTPSYVSYTDFHKEVASSEFTSLIQESGSNKIVGQRKDGKSVYTNLPSENNVVSLAQANNIAIEIRDPVPESALSKILGVLLFLTPALLLVGFMLYMHRRQSEMSMRGPEILSKAVKGNKTFIDPKDNPYRLNDVAGNDDIKKEVSEIIDFLKSPEVYQRVGARSPRGVLMSGPPGTGKTLLAKAIAGESGVPFYSASGSEFMEMFVGVGASRVRSLFESAKSNAPAIIFIDEIDAVGGSRSQQNQGGEERYQTLNQLLVEMDGFTTSSNVVVIAATNRADMLDSALTRPGRFDREVTLSLPDFNGRVDILKVHGKNIPVATNVDWEDVARGTPGFSGAELANLVNEAAVLAGREKETLVYRHHFQEARDKILMGVRLGTLKNEDERKLVAYHEAGHAVVARFTKHSEPVHKISIMPRGRALGVTVQLPKEDSYNNHGYNKLIEDIAVLMGGRAAERVALNEQTVGASNDFMRATVMARRIIASWGMDEELGPISVDGEHGHDWAQHNVWSEETKRDIDGRVKKLLKQQYALACEILTTNRALLDAVAQELVEKETVDGDEFEAIVKKFLPNT